MSEIRQFTGIVKRGNDIESKKSKLFPKKEIITDFESVLASGMLLEDMTILTELKTTNRHIRWYCCLMIHKQIKLLQQEKNFKDDDVMKIFSYRNLDESKVIKILKEVKSKQELFDNE